MLRQTYLYTRRLAIHHQSKIRLPPCGYPSLVFALPWFYTPRAALPVSIIAFWSSYCAVRFTQLIKQLAKRWRGRGIRLIPYVDDIFFINATRAEALRHRAVILADLQSAGFAVNFKKSQLEPTQPK
ncbi:hypothetical protein CLOM_g19041, partial [Closterium sp. NIES-68]